MNLYDPLNPNADRKECEPRVAVIRTSDRGTFRRCRRKWGFLSHLQRNMQPKQTASYFWIGTGGHFALEDYHGYNNYGSPIESFKAFVEAQRKWCKVTSHELPADWEEQAELGEKLMEYYLVWLQSREPLETFWYEGKPQVEVQVLVPLPMSEFPEHIREQYDEIYYSVTLDRVITTEDGLWICDYKYYKALKTHHLEYDDQATSYCWAGTVIYPDQPIKGFLIQQHLKDEPKPPRILKNGNISVAKDQRTTHRLYKEALEHVYGDASKAPTANILMLNDLAAQETLNRDKYIRRDWIERTPHHLQVHGMNVIDEAKEMLNPNLPLYPNPTNDCNWDCPVFEVCMAMNGGYDWEQLLDMTMIERSNNDEDDWRKFL